MAAKLDEASGYPLLEIGGKDDLAHEHTSPTPNQTSVQNAVQNAVASQAARSQQLRATKDDASVLTSGTPAYNAAGSVKMELEGATSNGTSLGITPTKMDTFQHTFQAAFPQNSLSSPFTSASAFQSPSSYPTVYQSTNELYDPTKSLTISGVRSALDTSSLQPHSKSSSTTSSLSPDPKPASNPTSSLTSPAPNTAGTPQTPAGLYDERFHILYEREIRWTEVRKYSEFIRKFATEASHMEITKENYYDLYNMALCLLKSVDGLDPDKLNRKANDQAAQSQYSIIASQLTGGVHPGAIVATTAPLSIQPQQQNGSVNDMEIIQRKNFDLFVNRGSNSAFDGTTYLNAIPKYAIPTTGDAQTIFYNQSNSEAGVAVGMSTYAVPLGTAATTPFQGSSSFLKADPLKPKNFTGEVFFDDLNQGDDRRPKRRRRRTVYSSRRNLHCHMCGVTETPEWRRGPAGDHTLCNACGLHYAKSLKKQRKERDARKHSIDMLLNESGGGAGGAGQPIPPATTGAPTSPTSPNNPSSPSSGSVPTPTPPSES